MSGDGGLDTGSLALARLDHLVGGLDTGSLALARLDHLVGVSLALARPDHLVGPIRVVEPGDEVSGVETRPAASGPAR